MTNRFKVSIEHDERDFWHVNAFFVHDDPGDDGDIPDACRTTKKGATRDDAIEMARKHYNPVSITVWDVCETCGGSGLMVDVDDEEVTECDDSDCEDGKVPVNI